MARVLVIDDEPDIGLGLRMLIERAGHSVEVATNGKDGLRAFFREPADLVVLDVGMPIMDCWETLERLRDLSAVPVLMLTARGLELEKVRGLQGGADDYQTKPYGNQELLARVGALLRRATTTPDATVETDTYADVRLEVDFARRQVLADGEEVQLSALEFRLLSAFIRNPGLVLTHEQLLELAWRDPGAGSRDQLKTYVRYLRRKLQWDVADSDPIESVRGVGYRYRAA